MARECFRFWHRRISAGLFAATAALILAGCGNDSSSGPTAGPTEGQSAPTIVGSPALTAIVGTRYSFIPSANDIDGDSLTLSVQNLPAWAAFNATTGEISGTPDVGDTGGYPGIVILASDGVNAAALPPFRIDVQQAGGFSATLSWLPPTTNANGTPLSDLAGYRIFYGTQSGNLTSSRQVNNPGIATFVIDNLSAGRYYFSVAAVDVNGNTSGRSAEVSGLIG